jgi:cell division septal protein FtsQ
MWFQKSSDRQRRRRADSLFSGRRSKRLWVQSGSSVKRTFRWRWLGSALVILVSVLALAVVLWVGLQYLEGSLFSRNDLFRIRDARDFRIACIGEVITPKHIMDYAQLTVCSNVFAIDIAEKRNYLLRTVPRVRSVKIARRLPHQLVIEVQERVSIARLEMRDYYLTVDRDGYVLGAAVGGSNLPVIGGHSMLGMRPGACLAGTVVMNALEVFDICETTPVRNRFKVLRIDLRNREALELSLADGERVTLAWQQMGKHDPLSRENLEQKLIKLAEILNVSAAMGKRIDTLDMSLDNNFPAPEYR